MKELLAKYLKIQKYQYLWEVKFFSMFQEKDVENFKNLLKIVVGTPKAAICLPQFKSNLSSDKEIVAFIKEINKSENQTCLVVAHVNYNPADLQAFYVLDCKEGEENECFQSIFNLWNKCSELYFAAINTNDIIKYVIPTKKSNHLFSKITSIFK